MAETSLKRSGTSRMDSTWIRKLWIDFDRDQNNADEEQDEFNENTPLLDLEELRLDNHTATIANLTELRDYIRFERGRVTLNKLEFTKVLFTQEKTLLIVDVLTSPNCKANELVLDSCRAKADKMSQVFAALVHNKSILNLTMKDMYIPLASFDQFITVLQKNKRLLMLTLQNTGLTDSAIEKLSQGLLGNRNLVYLDLRGNTYENEGLQALLRSLMGNQQLQTLRLNTLQILHESAKSFQQLFSNESCHIKNLEMEELEVAEDGACAVIDAITGLRRLHTFDFSNNTVPAALAKSIVAMVDKYRMMEILCLDHCEMSDEIFRYIFQNINNERLIFLNLSWNQLSGDTVDLIVRVLDNNPNLQKLAIQHNRYGEVDLSNFAKSLSSHRGLTYLDVSANNIGNTQFNIVYKAVQSNLSQLSTFHCRKNRIGGEKIMKTLRQCSTSNLSVIDFSSNKLTEDNVNMLLEQARENFKFVEVKVAKNVMVNASMINDISEECRQNILIQKKILRYLPFKNGRNIQSPTSSKNFYDEYDCSELVLKDQRLFHFDFALKFIKQNNSICTKLVLQNLDITRVQDQIRRGLDSHNDFQLAKLRILHIENTDLQEKPLRRLIKSLKQMKELRELSIINLAILEKFMDELTDGIKGCTYLSLLNLRQDNLRTREVSSLVPLLANNHTIETLDISTAIISKNNMIHLWLALHKNIGVCELDYCRLNFFAIMEMKAIDAELNLNKLIRDRIKPHFESQNKGRNKRQELSMRGFPVERSVVPAILKYLKMQTQMTSLDLSGTGLTRFDINQFIKEIVKREVKLTKLNLSENASVNDMAINDLCQLFLGHSTMQKLYLDRTSITEDGLVKLLASTTQSLKVSTISVADCDMTFTSMTGKFITECLQKNISITEFKYHGNAYDMDFKVGVDKELSLNQQITKNILPQLVKQEDDARKKHKQNKQDRKQRGSKPKTGIVRSKSNLKKVNQKDTVKIVKGQSDAKKRRTSKQFKDEQVAAEFLQKGEGKDDEFLQPRRGMSDLVPMSQDNSIDGESKRRGSFNNKNTSRAHSDGNISADEGNTESESEEDQEEEEESAKSEDSLGDDDNFAMMQEQGGFNLSMKDIKLENGIDFLTKFTRVFQKIESIDFGAHNIQQGDAAQLSEELKMNKYIQNVVVKKRAMGGEQAKMFQREIAKNKAIYDLAQNTNMDKDSKALDLAGKNLSDLSFLPKMMKDFTKLETLDLSNSDLRQKESVRQLCKMIDENSTITSLIVRNCKINASNLSLIAGALTKENNQFMTNLDIRDNPIQDPQYKVLFGLLQNNSSLLQLDYTLYDDANIASLEEYRQMHKEGLSAMEISVKLDHSASHGHHHTPLWKKICFPVWLWQSLIHDKHEAFRFKYDTVAITRIEKTLMPRIRIQLYMWSFVYYMIVLVLPYVAIRHECGKTYDPWLYYLYGGYLALQGIWEVWQVLAIQKLAQNKRILQFNSWHVVELFMGSIARTDTFLDILFLHLIMNCWDSFVPYVYSSLSFAIVNLIFPLLMLVRLLKPEVGNTLVQPYMENTCFIAFIRETMLLATVLDSFCINNSFYFGSQPVVFGKLMGFFSFLTQDFPQLSIHVIFKLVIISDAQKKLKKQTLLIVGMVCSSLAICISIFNMVMCQQNEFDPITVEKELQKRVVAHKLKQEKLALQQTENATASRRAEFKSGLQKSLMDPQKAKSLAGNEFKHSQTMGGGKRKKLPEPKLSLMEQLKGKFSGSKDQEDGVQKQMNEYMQYRDGAVDDEQNSPIRQFQAPKDEDDQESSQRHLLSGERDQMPPVIMQDYTSNNDKRRKTQIVKVTRGKIEYGGHYRKNDQKKNQVQHSENETGMSELCNSGPRPNDSPAAANILVQEAFSAKSVNSSGSKQQGLIKKLRDDRLPPIDNRQNLNKINPSYTAGVANFSNESHERVDDLVQLQDESFETNELADEVQNLNIDQQSISLRPESRANKLMDEQQKSQDMIVEQASQSKSIKQAENWKKSLTPNKKNVSSEHVTTEGFGRSVSPLPHQTRLDFTNVAAASPSPANPIQFNGPTQNNMLADDTFSIESDAAKTLE